jgi:hypothetical protein
MGDRRQKHPRGKNQGQRDVASVHTSSISSATAVPRIGISAATS